MNLLILDDHQLIRDVVGHYIGSTTDIDVMTADTIDDALEAIETNGPFSCVLVDLRMPGVRSALDLKVIVEANNPMPVMLFSGVATYADLYSARRVGLVGFLRKDMPVQDAVEIVTAIAKDPSTIPPSVCIDVHTRINSVMLGKLSEEDGCILELLAGGARNAQIADTLDIKLNRVEHRLRKIYRTLGVTSRLAAAKYVNAQARKI